MGFLVQNSNIFSMKGYLGYILDQFPIINKIKFTQTTYNLLLKAFWIYIFWFLNVKRHLFADIIAYTTPLWASNFEWLKACENWPVFVDWILVLIICILYIYIYI